MKLKHQHVWEQTFIHPKERVFICTSKSCTSGLIMRNGVLNHARRIPAPYPEYHFTPIAIGNVPPIAAHAD